MTKTRPSNWKQQKKNEEVNTQDRVDANRWKRVLTFLPEMDYLMETVFTSNIVQS